jgi:hypothetical protein
MKNQCIKVLNEEHGKKVIEYFKSLGVDTRGYTGFEINAYYGVFDGIFNAYSTPLNSEVIELPTEQEFKRGDKVLVWDDDESRAKERIFLTKIEGAIHPYVCVHKGYESAFLEGKLFHTYSYENCKPLPELQLIELTLQDISDGKGVGVDPSLIRIKK